MIPWRIEATIGPSQWIQWYEVKCEPTIAPKHLAGFPPVNIRWALRNSRWNQMTAQRLIRTEASVSDLAIASPKACDSENNTNKDRTKSWTKHFSLAWIEAHAEWQEYEHEIGGNFDGKCASYWHYRSVYDTSGDDKLQRLAEESEYEGSRKAKSQQGNNEGKRLMLVDTHRSGVKATSQ